MSGIKSQTVAGGKKIILRHTSGPQTGKLAGSVSLAGRGGIQTIKRPGVPIRLLDGEVWATPDVNETFIRFQKSSPSSLIPDVEEELFDPNLYRAEWFEKLSEQEQLTYLVTRTLPTGLGEDQAKYSYDALKRAAKKWVRDGIAEEPTDDEWQEWLAQTALKIVKEDNELSDERREELLGRLGRVAAGEKPDAYTFAVISKAASRTWRAKFALDDQARQIAGWVDADQYEVMGRISGFRDEYYMLKDAGQEPKIPDQYFKAFRSQQNGAPKDEATIWSHYKAENDALYLDPVPTKKYVAFDLETTGTAPWKDHIIEIGIVEYDSHGKEIGSWSQMVRPPLIDGKLSTGDPDVVAVHKITPDMVADAPTFEEVMAEFRERTKGATLIGHNLAFDTGFARTKLRMYAPEGDYEAKQAPWLREADTMTHFKRHEQGLENNKLVTVSASLGIPYTNGHRAEHDARSTGQVFFAIRAKKKRRQRDAIRKAKQALSDTTNSDNS